MTRSTPAHQRRRSTLSGDGPRSPEVQMPAVSVVIPTRDRQATLRATLATLAAQEYPATGCDFEVIVVLDGCRDGSRQMLDQLQPPFEMRIIEKAHGGAGAARNAGAAVARAELLLFLDDDIRADPGLVREHLAAQRKHGPMVGIGRLTFRATHGDAGLVRFLSDWWKSHDERLTREPESADSTDAYAGNICLPRAWINAVGGFAIDLPRPDDVELAFRLEMAGHPFRYLPGAAGRQQFDKSPAAIRRDARLEGNRGRGAPAASPSHTAPTSAGEFRNRGVGDRLDDANAFA